MRGFKTLLSATALLAGLALVPAARAQIAVEIGAPPVCQYGYYEAAPYGCAPMGFYGPGYFYNGIFLGMGPWGGWGYSHGWGSHRFVNEGGVNYHGGPGQMSYRGSGNQGRGGGQFRGNAQGSRGGGARPSAGRQVGHGSGSHNSGGGGSRGGGGGHQGGGGGRH